MFKKVLRKLIQASIIEYFATAVSYASEIFIVSAPSVIFI
jgi:hypothetical protein